MYLDTNGSIYRLLIEQEQGGWLIPYETPGAPFFLARGEWGQRVAVPAEPNCPKTQAEQKRLDMIRPLTEERACITDKTLRRRMAVRIAEEHHTTPRRVLRLYYTFLAHGTIQLKRKARKPKREEQKKIFAAAIERYYLSAKRPSLRDAYDCLLLEQYTDEEGKLLSEYPSWHSFRQYYYRSGMHKKSHKIIAREGLSDYQRNHRLLGGSAPLWKDRLGSYQMDATQADIYLVSSFDRSLVIGRPNIYMAVDTVSELIAGIYVGLEAGENAVMACLANAAADKVEFCSKYGIHITQEQWPSSGLPAEIITDKGREFESARVDELCVRYGMERESLPPFRPDRKSLVEKTFDLLQNRYKSLLRGKGVIEPDAQERWSTDYRSQAVLTLEEYTELLIRIILYLNNRPLKNYPASTEMLQQQVPMTPAGIWRWMQENGRSDLLEVEKEEIYCLALPRKEARVTRRGVEWDGFVYINPELRNLLEQLRGQKVTVAFDAQNTAKAYLLYESGYLPLALAQSCSCYTGMAAAEAQLYRKHAQETIHMLDKQDVQARIELLRSAKELVRQAENGGIKRRQSGSEISANRETERRKRT